MSAEAKISTQISENFKALINTCINYNIPFVAYSLPQQVNAVTLVQFNSFPRRIEIESHLEERKGFIIAPFNENNDSCTYLIEPDITLNSKDVNKEIIQHLSTINRFRNKQNISKNASYIATQEEFEQNVTKIKDAIKNGLAEKVVLSRLHLEECLNNIDVAEIFLDINTSYPDAFRYIFKMPDTDCWIGASPEPLLLVNGNMAETVSLAATKKMNGTPIDKIVWNSKEMQEQNYVTKYIENLLVDFGIKDFKENGPSSQKAGQLVHLKSVFNFNSEQFFNSPGKFINTLHPTPSVCGIPKKASIHLLKKMEKHNREYYTGFLGPLNMNNQTNLFVNIRCMKKQGNIFVLYQGAGITEGSDPTSEWNETQQKMMTMLSVLRKHFSGK